MAGPLEAFKILHVGPSVRVPQRNIPSVLSVSLPYCPAVARGRWPPNGSDSYGVNTDRAEGILPPGLSSPAGGPRNRLFEAAPDWNVGNVANHAGKGIGMAKICRRQTMGLVITCCLGTNLAVLWKKYYIFIWF